MSYQTKVYRKQGGAEMVVADGGVLNIETGGIIKTNGAQGAALTAQVTSITHAALGTPDYAIQDFVDAVAGAFAFKSKDEANTVLSVILNLQVRLAEVEARLKALGIIV